MGQLEKHVLVLNKSWRVVGVTSVRNAITLLTRDSARSLCPKSFRPYTWEEWIEDKIDPPKVENFIKSSSVDIATPEIILLNNFNGVYRKRERFSSKSVYRRDNYTCGYCLRRFPESELSVDHIIPRSRKGKSSYLNTVTCCRKCNTKKGDSLLDECGMILHIVPSKPKWDPFIYVRQKPESWEKFFDEWNADSPPQ